MAGIVESVEAALDLLDFYDYLYPLNYDTEQTKFFNALDHDKVYNPTFEYRTFTAKERNKAARHLQDVKEQLDESDRLSERFIVQLKDRKRIIEAIGSNTITDVSRDIYGFPGQEMVQEAENLLNPKHIPEDEEKHVSAETLQAAYTELFDLLGMDYRCTLVDAETIRNNPRQRTIMIPVDGGYGVTQAKRMLIHESTHSVRTYNGIEANNAALIYGTQGYQVAEEGLPTFNEYAVDVFDDTLPRITSRVIAIDNIDKSFYDLYQLMRQKGLGRRLAYIRTYRVKRGLPDTSMSGGFIKDHIYFQGYSMLKDRPELAADLYIGKVSVGDMADIPGLTDRTPPISRSHHLNAYEQAAKRISMD